jgi:hypothetical protein
MDTQTKVGQVFMIAIDGSKPSRALTDLIRAWQPGGIVLFSRNIGSANDLKALIAGAQAAAPLPLLVATDQEGGSVTRIHVGLTPLPAEAVYGAIGSAARVYQDTLAQGKALKSLGINLDLAPVVDVRVNTKSAIGSRSYGPDPALDSILVTAAVLGYQAAGIGATAKHFIGLGEVQANADLNLPVVKASRAEIEARDMPHCLCVAAHDWHDYPRGARLQGSPDNRQSGDPRNLRRARSGNRCDRRAGCRRRHAASGQRCGHTGHASAQSSCGSDERDREGYDPRCSPRSGGASGARSEGKAGSAARLPGVSGPGERGKRMILCHHNALT